MNRWLQVVVMAVILAWSAGATVAMAQEQLQPPARINPTPNYATQPGSVPVTTAPNAQPIMVNQNMAPMYGNQGYGSPSGPMTMGGGCANCGNGGYGGYGMGGSGLMPDAANCPCVKSWGDGYVPVLPSPSGPTPICLNCLNKMGLGCQATCNSPCCTSCSAQCTFIFGSCRQWYGEPCQPIEPKPCCQWFTNWSKKLFGTSQY